MKDSSRGVRPAVRPKIIHCHRCDALLGKAQRQLLVELMQPPDVREDQHLRAGGLSWPRGKRSETVAIRRGQDEIVSLHLTGSLWWEWWACFVVITHRRNSFQRPA